MTRTSECSSGEVIIASPNANHQGGSMEDWLAVGGSLFESFMSWLEGPSLEIPTATATRKEQQHVGIQQELVHIGHSTAVYRVAHIPGR